MAFWTRPWDVLQANKGLQHVVIQNHQLLELGGEPCYLLHRKRQGDLQEGTKDFPFDLDPTTMRFYCQLWAPADGNGNFVDPRNLEIRVNNVVWTQVPDAEDLTAGAQEYYLVIQRDKMDTDGNLYPDGVWVYFSTPPFAGDSNTHVSWSYSNICYCWDLHSYQPTIANCPTCFSAEWGWDQYLNPGFTYRNRDFPNGFLLAFPALELNLAMQDRGFVREGKITHWTSPPPLSPEVYEHDVIVVPRLGIRMEVINQTQGMIDGVPVFQGFEVVEVEPNAPVYSVTVATQ